MHSVPYEGQLDTPPYYSVDSFNALHDITLLNVSTRGTESDPTAELIQRGTGQCS